MSHSTLTRKLARVKPGTLFVGVDLALDRNVAVVLTERAEQLARLGFPNDRNGYDYFYHRLEAVQERRQAPAVWIGMEPTSYFWKLLAADMEQHRPDYDYWLVNPFTVKKTREGTQLDHSKDDNRDALIIGELVRTGKYTETRLLHGAYAELRQYMTLYARLQRDFRRQKTLIRNTAGQLFPELCAAFKDLTGGTALAMLRRHAAAALIRTMSQDAFIAGVRDDFEGQRLRLAKLRDVYTLANRSVGLRQGVEALQLSLRLHIEAFEACRLQLEEVCIAVSDTFLALPDSRALLSVPRLGLLTAATILSEIGDPSHYRNGRQLVKLAGIQPVPNTSGRKTRSKTPMSHKGRPRLRTALFFAVMRLLQVDEAFAQDYQQLQTREKNPLTKMQAIGALMNKLLRILWSLMRNDTLYISGFQRVA
jgi:transposase